MRLCEAVQWAQAQGCVAAGVNWETELRHAHTHTLRDKTYSILQMGIYPKQNVCWECAHLICLAEMLFFFFSDRGYMMRWRWKNVILFHNSAHFSSEICLRIASLYRVVLSTRQTNLLQMKRVLYTAPAIHTESRWRPSWSEQRLWPSVLSHTLVTEI